MYKEKMRKIAISLMLGFGLLVTLVGCGNYNFLDTTYQFDYAILELPNGEVVEGNIVSWRDYDGEQLQVTLEDGNTYLISSYNAVLITSKEQTE